MVRAAAGRELKIMAPMVSSVEEFDAAREMLDREVAFARATGREAPESVRLGAMVEVPSLLWQLDEILSRADFLSVGSNDLQQYIFAADRNNKRVANRFDALSPSFLRALRTIAAAGARAGKPVTLCGEIGGRPLEAMTLIALGYRDLSMSATSIGPVKAMALSLAAKDAAHEVGKLVDGGATGSLREPLRELANRLGVRL